MINIIHATYWKDLKIWKSKKKTKESPRMPLPIANNTVNTLVHTLPDSWVLMWGFVCECTHFYIQVQQKGGLQLFL